MLSKLTLSIVAACAAFGLAASPASAADRYAAGPLYHSDQSTAVCYVHFTSTTAGGATLQGQVAFSSESNNTLTDGGGSCSKTDQQVNGKTCSLITTKLGSGAYSCIVIVSDPKGVAFGSIDLRDAAGKTLISAPLILFQRGY